MAGVLIRVAIVDDHPVVAAGMATLLRSEPDLDVKGVVESVDAARAAGFDRADVIDVLLLDLRLGEGSGLELLSPGDGAPARAAPARSAIIVLTAYDYPQYADAAARLGAAGFVLKTAPLADLLAAIRRVAAGGQAFTARPTGGSVRLTPREREVVGLVVEGLTNDEIALALGIGAKTVETHLTRIFERTGIGSRTELAARAVREGWLDVPG